MLQSTTPRPTLHLATPSYNTADLKYYTEEGVYTQLHNYVRCLAYTYIEKFKYYSAPNYYQTEVHMYYISSSPHLVTTIYAAPSCIPKFWNIFWMCWKIVEIQDWLINHSCMSIFS
jgi:hypothetical protein